jgi:hypothetical protein
MRYASVSSVVLGLNAGTILIFSECHARRVSRDYVTFFNHSRPHQGIKQQIPEPVTLPPLPQEKPRHVIGLSVLNGFRHDYRRAAWLGFSPSDGLTDPDTPQDEPACPREVPASLPVGEPIGIPGPSLTLRVVQSIPKSATW